MAPPFDESLMEKKHPCPDCKQCQWCSDERCRMCLRTATGCKRKLSFAEQIALYERVNAEARSAAEPSLPCPKPDPD